MLVDLWKLGVQVLLEGDTKFLAEGLELVKVLLVLPGVFDFGFDSLEDTDGSWEVVHTSGSTEGSYDDGGSWDQVVGEGIVKVALKLEDVVHSIEFLLIPSRELFKRFLVGISRVRPDRGCNHP